MTLHPESQRLLRHLRTLDWSTSEPADAARLRAVFAAESHEFGGPPRSMHQVLERSVETLDHRIPVRIYVPTDRALIGSLVWLHGGGFVFGSINSSDLAARAIAAAANCLVVSVGYRLAPEHPFPAGLEDAYAVVRWLSEHAADFGAPASRVAVGGDSAGGCLAAATTLLARERDEPSIEHQVLVYPMTGSGLEVPQPARLDGVTHPPPRWIQWLWSLYLDGHDPLTPLASPLRAPTLGGLPPALVLTAEYDTLRAEGEQYARRLREAGVPVEFRQFDGMIHGFLEFSGVPGLAEYADQAISSIGEALRQAFSTAPAISMRPDRRRSIGSRGTKQ